ncbi:MAG: potassium channel protein [Aphanocapsa lilacina HA4352-LM1]|jgi:voltage-gated potassium channel|nr:potassium channel protein [Aphanocapsa lilacina HA4352-LM1]
MSPPSAERLREFRWRIFNIVMAIVGLYVVGVIGYMVIEGWDFFDALYMTVITLAGVGYGETRPLNTDGRIFTIVLIVLGVATLGILIGRIVQALGEGYLQEGLKYTRQKRMLSQLKDHFIICGYGRMGSRICEELTISHAQFVVIEADPRAALLARSKGYRIIEGDASADQTLVEAGIERACSVICALTSDADNLFIVLSARNLNPKIRTITRASSEEAAVKLRRGGADEVVSPYTAGARRMAAIALRPGVVDFIETAFSGTGGSSLIVEEVKLDERSCPFVGMSLQQINLRNRSGGLVVAIRRADGTLVGSPTGETILAQGDILFCLGTDAQLRTLSEALLPVKT